MWAYVWWVFRVAVHCVLPLYQLNKACGRTFGVCVVLPYTVFYRYTSYIKRVDVRLVSVSCCCTLCFPLYQLHKAFGRTFGEWFVLPYTVFYHYTSYIKRLDVRLVSVSFCRTLCFPLYQLHKACGRTFGVCVSFCRTRCSTVIPVTLSVWTYVWWVFRVAVHCVIPLCQLHKACGRTFGECFVLPYTVLYRYASYIKRVDVRLVSVSWCCTLCSTVIPVTLSVWTYVWWVFRFAAHCVFRYTSYIKRLDVRLVCVFRFAVHGVLPLYQLHKACGRTFGECVVMLYTVLYRYASYIKSVDVRLVSVSWCCTLCSTVIPVT